MQLISLCAENVREIRKYGAHIHIASKTNPRTSLLSIFTQIIGGSFRFDLPLRLLICAAVCMIREFVESVPCFADLGSASHGADSHSDMMTDNNDNMDQLD